MNPAIVDKLFSAMQHAKGIPALEATVVGILTSLRDVQKGYRDLAAQISEDFTLTQKVLKLANSAMYAPFANGVASVSSALNVLGSDALLHLVLGTAMISSADLREDESLSRTLLASELARSVSGERREDVSIAALMFDLGNLMAGRFLPDEVAAIDRRTGAGESRDAVARDVLGMSFQELGARVAKRWRLPDEIVSIIDGTGDEMLVGIARFSVQASSMIHAGDEAAVKELVAALDIPGVDKTSLADLVGRKLNEIIPLAKPTQDDTTDLHLARLHESLSSEEYDSVEDLSRAMFPDLALALDASRCLLFMAVKSGDFWIRCVQGKGVEELRSRLRVSAEYKPTAFHAAIRNNADVVINEVAKLKPAALPEGYSSYLPNVTSFVILPIANTRVSGLLYLDWETPRRLTPSNLAALRTLRDMFLGLFPR